MESVSAVWLVVALVAAFLFGWRTARLLLVRRRSVGDALVHGKTFVRRGRRALLAHPFIAAQVERARGAKHTAAMRAAMPEALRLMCVSLDSGATLAKALEYAANNCSEPLATELKQVVWDLQAGVSFDVALERLRERCGGTEFSYFAVAMEIQHSSGASFGSVLASVSQALQVSSEMEESLKTKTTQAQASSKIVAVMPVIILALLSLFSKGYVSQFFASPIGVVMFVFAVLLELVGIAWIRKTTSFATLVA